MALDSNSLSSAVLAGLRSPNRRSAGTAADASSVELFCSLLLIGELLPPDGGFQHGPTDGAHHHRDAIDKGGVCGDPRLQHHGRGVGGKVELALLEPVKGSLVLEHKQLAKALSPGLQAHRPLRQVAVANMPPLLVHYPPAVGATYDEAPLPHVGE